MENKKTTIEINEKTTRDKITIEKSGMQRQKENSKQRAEEEMRKHPKIVSFNDLVNNDTVKHKFLNDEHIEPAEMFFDFKEETYAVLAKQYKHLPNSKYYYDIYGLIKNSSNTINVTSSSSREDILNELSKVKEGYNGERTYKKCKMFTKYLLDEKWRAEYERLLLDFTTKYSTPKNEVSNNVVKDINNEPKVIKDKASRSASLNSLLFKLLILLIVAILIIQFEIGSYHVGSKTMFTFKWVILKSLGKLWTSLAGRFPLLTILILIGGVFIFIHKITDR